MLYFGWQTQPSSNTISSYLKKAGAQNLTRNCVTFKSLKLTVQKIPWLFQLQHPLTPQAYLETRPRKVQANNGFLLNSISFFIIIIIKKICFLHKVTNSSCKMLDVVILKVWTPRQLNCACKCGGLHQFPLIYNLCKMPTNSICVTFKYFLITWFLKSFYAQNKS